MKYLWSTSGYLIWKTYTLVKIKGPNYYSIFSIVGKLDRNNKNQKSFKYHHCIK